MICTNCNKEISDNETFCPYCGQNVRVSHNVAPLPSDEDVIHKNLDTENIEAKPDYIRKNKNPDRESALDKLTEAFLDSDTQIPEHSTEDGEKLEKTAMILGIIAIVLSAIRWISALGLILAITGLILISKAINIYKRSRKTMFRRCKTAYILCSIGLCLSLGITVYWGLIAIL